MAYIDTYVDVDIHDGKMTITKNSSKTIINLHNIVSVELNDALNDNDPAYIVINSHISFDEKYSPEQFNALKNYFFNEKSNVDESKGSKKHNYEVF